MLQDTRFVAYHPSMLAKALTDVDIPAAQWPELLRRARALALEVGSAWIAESASLGADALEESGAGG